MGGNALSTPSVRLTKSNYDALKDECVAQLRALYPAGQVEAIRAYREKADFGDLDILVAAENYDPGVAAQSLGATEVVRNGPVTSLGVKVRPELSELEGNVFQVDLIKMADDEFDFARNYFAWNDAGNLVGRIAKSLFTSLRHDGLYFYHRDGDYKFREILLTKDFGQALAYLGYEPQPYVAGFDSLRGIFEFVASTPFFNREIFLLENRNYKAKVRDRKRKTYTEFLKWCEVTPGLTAYAFPEDDNQWLPRLYEHFPAFEIDYARSLADLARQRAVKEKFNGQWVSELTGLQGKELGHLMKAFRESFESREAQDEFILSSELNALANRVKAVQALLPG